MKKAELGQRIQGELQGIIKLSPFVFALLVVMILLWRTDSVANSGLFQSSPVQTPATLTSTPAMEVSATATSTQPPTVPPSPDATGTPEIPTAAATGSVAPLETATQVLPADTASPEATLAPTELTVTDTPTTTLPSETAEPGATADQDLRYPEGESNLRFEWGMLFDSLALFFSYVWLFCGILLFVSVPLLFFLLWRSSAQRQEEATPEEAEQQEAKQEEE